MFTQFRTANLLGRTIESRSVCRLAYSYTTTTASRRLGTRQLPKSVPSSRNTAAAYGVLASVLIASAAVAFNHQKSSASITHSTFYAIRKDPIAIAALGENIRYRDYWPWISGEINQIKGNINFSYAVKGDRSEGRLHFQCVRHVKDSQDWNILDWSLMLPSGENVALTRDDLAG